MKWLWFNLAALIVFFALVLHGAPFIPVLAGVILVALWNYMKYRARASRPNA
jgi:hypothetical protein